MNRWSSTSWRSAPACSAASCGSISVSSPAAAHGLAEMLPPLGEQQLGTLALAEQADELGEETVLLVRFGQALADAGLDAGAQADGFGDEARPAVLLAVDAGDDCLHATRGVRRSAGAHTPGNDLAGTKATPPCGHSPVASGARRGRRPPGISGRAKE